MNINNDYQEVYEESYIASGEGSEFVNMEDGQFQLYENYMPMISQGLLPKKSRQPKKQAKPGQRKPCNCTKSLCLKLYCECFANGEYCKDCNCKTCHNNTEYENERTLAIRQSLGRNPNAFKPKIGINRGGTTDLERLHQKGCNCKKSNCLKNYCECYEAKVACTARCKCVGCKNDDNCRNSDHHIKPSFQLQSILPSSSPPRVSNDVTESGAASTDDQSEIDEKVQLWMNMTDEVIEAATLCMVAQADEALSFPNMTERERTLNMEYLILHEFQRCTNQLIQSSATPTSSSKF